MTSVSFILLTARFIAIPKCWLKWEVQMNSPSMCIFCKCVTRKRRCLAYWGCFQYAQVTSLHAFALYL